MVLDEPADDDEVFKVKDFTMIMSKDLVEQAKDVTVDYVVYGMGSGFKLTSEVPVGGGGCGSTSCHC